MEDKEKAAAEAKAKEEKARAEAEAKAKKEAGGKEEKKNALGEKLIEEALKAYGIGKNYVLGARYDAQNEQAVIVTVGGKKVRYAAGDKVKPLDSIAITGVNPAAKRKPIAGAEKK